MKVLKEVLKKIYFALHQDVRYYLDSKTNCYLYDIWSYCQNQALINQGCVKNAISYKYYRGIHENLVVHELDGTNLVRIGKDADGGYFIAKGSNGYTSVECEKIAYSLGIANDVSWDIEMAEAGYEIYQYDHTIKKLPQQNPRFHWKRIGIGGNDTTRNLRTLDYLIKENGHSDNLGLILKSDIEGAEWDMFDNMSEVQIAQFDQILIELHNLVLGNNKEQILRVLRKIAKSHVAVHVHANNNSVVNYCDDMITPDLLEVTFVNRNNYKLVESSKVYPLDIDHINHIKKQDILLGRWNLN